MSNYNKKILYLAMTRPKKIPALFRLVTGARRFGRINYLRKDNLSTPPITVAINPTYRINPVKTQQGLGGAGVHNNIDGGLQARELTTDQLKSFISDISRFRPYICFNGAAPILRNDIFELINFAGSRNLLTCLVTDYELLDNKAADTVDSGVDYLIVTFDGFPKTGGVQSAPTNFMAKTVAYRKQLYTQMPLIQVQFTITRENQYDILKTAKYIEEELRPDAFGIAPGVFTTDSLYRATSHIYRQELGVEQKYWKAFVKNVEEMDANAIEEQINEIRRMKWSFRLRLYPPIGYKDFTFYDYFSNPDKIFGEIFCAVPFIFTQLHPNGDIVTCGNGSDYVAGNIVENRFNDIWNGERYQKFREFVKKKLSPACPRCWALYEFYAYND